MLETHSPGGLLDTIDAVIQFAATMSWKGQSPVLELVTTTYQTGVKLTKEAMQMLETQLQRLAGLGKWFVDIVAPSSTVWAT
jgi:Rhodopirellula transposase DDE domain